MVDASLRWLFCALLLLSHSAALFDTEETNPKTIRCAQGSMHASKSIEIEEERTLGCRLTLIYDEYFIVRNIYYDFHRMGVESNMTMDCDEDGFVSVICKDSPMCNQKIADGLTKGSKDTVARNYYLQCLYHRSIQRKQKFIGAVLQGCLLNVVYITIVFVFLLIVRKYKKAKRQNTIDMVQAYERKKEYRDKLEAQARKLKEERDRKNTEDQMNQLKSKGVVELPAQPKSEQK